MSDHCVIQASAGSGKTYQLTNRYLQLVARDVAPDQILATTFTRKAAGEILDRVLVRIAEAAASPAASEELAGALQVDDLNQERCQEMLRAVIDQLHRLRICTLDSLFAQLAGAFGWDLGLPQAWRVAEEMENNQLRDSCLSDVLTGDSSQEIERLMQFVPHGETARSVSDQVRDAVTKLYHVYRAAGAEAWNALPKPMFPTNEEINACLTALRKIDIPNDKRMANARDTDCDLFEQQEWSAFISKGLSKKIIEGNDHYYRKPIPHDLKDGYMTLIRFVRAHYTQEIASQTSATYDLLKKYDQVYQSRQQEARVFSFDDITFALSRSQEWNDERRQAYRLDGSIRHLLLDEFQDTSRLQWKILRPLAERITAPEKRSDGDPHVPAKSFFCVGDSKQAIYGWRGGNAAILGTVASTLPDVESAELSKSWRSSEVVIKVVNQVFQGMHRHPKLEHYQSAVDAWQKQFPQHSTEQNHLPGYVEMVAADGPDKEDVLRDAVQRIREIYERAAGRSIGVLVRTNEVVANIAEQLRSLEIPVSEEGGTTLESSPAVQLVLSFLRAIDHPYDGPACFHVAHSPLGKLIGLNEWNDRDCMLAASQQYRSQLLYRGYGRVVLDLARQLAAACTQLEQQRLQQLVERAFAYERLAGPRTRGFHHFLTTQRVSEPIATSVRIMTVHQAKGLEFDIVVLPQLDAQLVREKNPCCTGYDSPTGDLQRVTVRRDGHIRQLLPDTIQRDFEEDRDRAVHESLCLLYVAMTRARQALYMIVEASPKSGKHPAKTFAGLIRAALTDGSPLLPKTTVFCAGSPDWWDLGPSVERAKTSDEDLSLGPIVWNKPAVRQLEWLRPSEMVHDRRLHGRDLLRSQTDQARRHGTLFHAWCEQIEWLDQGLPDDRVLRRSIRAPMPDREFTALKEQFATMITAPQFEPLLQKKSYRADVQAQTGMEPGSLEVVVRREHPFAALYDGRLVSGTFDRLVLAFHRDQLITAQVVDFKTDHVRDGDHLQKLIERYRSQLAAYATAVSHIYGLAPDRVSTRLALLRVPAVVDMATPGEATRT